MMQIAAPENAAAGAEVTSGETLPSSRFYPYWLKFRLVNCLAK